MFRARALTLPGPPAPLRPGPRPTFGPSSTAVHPAPRPRADNRADTCVTEANALLLPVPAWAAIGTTTAPSARTPAIAAPAAVLRLPCPR
jgi:hypothetical protein